MKMKLPLIVLLLILGSSCNDKKETVFVSESGKKERKVKELSFEEEMAEIQTSYKNSKITKDSASKRVRAAFMSLDDISFEGDDFTPEQVETESQSKLNRILETLLVINSKEDKSILSDLGFIIGLNSSSLAKVSDKETSNEKLNELFYELSDNINIVDENQEILLAQFLMRHRASVDISSSTLIDLSGAAFFYKAKLASSLETSNNSTESFRRYAYVNRFLKDRRTYDVFSEIVPELSIQKSDSTQVHETFNRMVREFSNDPRIVFPTLNMLKSVVENNKWIIENYLDFKSGSFTEGISLLTTNYKFLDNFTRYQLPEDMYANDFYKVHDQHIFDVDLELQEKFFLAMTKHGLAQTDFQILHSFLRQIYFQALIRSGQAARINNPFGSFKEYQESFQETSKLDITTRADLEDLDTEEKKIKTYLASYYRVQARKFFLFHQRTKEQSLVDRDIRIINREYNLLREDLIYTLNLRYNKRVSLEELQTNEVQSLFTELSEEYFDETSTSEKIVFYPCKGLNQTPMPKINCNVLPGVYSFNSDKVSILADGITQHPLSLYYLPGKTVFIEANRSNNLWIDVSGPIQDQNSLPNENVGAIPQIKQGWVDPVYHFFVDTPLPSGTNYEIEKLSPGVNTSGITGYPGGNIILPNKLNFSGLNILNVSGGKGGIGVTGHDSPFLRTPYPKGYEVNIPQGKFLMTLGINPNDPSIEKVSAGLGGDGGNGGRPGDIIGLTPQNEKAYTLLLNHEGAKGLCGKPGKGPVPEDKRECDFE
jgi:hypothetical protein